MDLRHDSGSGARADGIVSRLALKLVSWQEQDASSSWPHS